MVSGARSGCSRLGWSVTGDRSIVRRLVARSCAENETGLSTPVDLLTNPVISACQPVLEFDLWLPIEDSPGKRDVSVSSSYPLRSVQLILLSDSFRRDTDDHVC